MDLTRPDVLPSLNDPERARLDLLHRKLSADITLQAREERGDPVPPVLYHYTDATGLLGIFNEAQIRASHVGYLNDRSEIQHSLQLFRAASKAHRDSGVDENLAEFLAGLETALDEPVKNIAEMAQVWVACFCDAPDLLSQWRGYGGAQGGYAIGFDFSKLQKFVVTQKGWSLAPCIYDGKFQISTVAAFLREIVEIYLSGRGRFGPENLHDYRNDLLNLAFNDISWFGALFKDEAFFEEREWRIYARGEGGHVPEICFAARASAVTQFVNFSFAQRNKDQPIPLHSIMVGPSRNQDISRAAIQKMLSQKGYSNPAVFLSEIPLRSF